MGIVSSLLSFLILPHESRERSFKAADEHFAYASFAYEEMGSFKIIGSITDTGGTFVFHSLGVVCFGSMLMVKEYGWLNDRVLRFD